ncbi:uncharacterized protein [Oryctolagus cuniculus]|uniref:uncharacterized protein n=1 Tax=Oryctolagus cuniculus TaxID=9986 RepID=UPI0038795317
MGSRAACGSRPFLGFPAPALPSLRPPRRRPPASPSGFSCAALQAAVPGCRRREGWTILEAAVGGFLREPELQSNLGRAEVPPAGWRRVVGIASHCCLIGCRCCQVSLTSLPLSGNQDC